MPFAFVQSPLNTEKSQSSPLSPDSVRTLSQETSLGSLRFLFVRGPHPKKAHFGLSSDSADFFFEVLSSQTAALLTTPSRSVLHH